VGTALYVKLSAFEVNVVPPAVVTVTSTVPALPAGDTAVSLVVLTTFTDVPAVAPKRTVDAAVKPVPLTATVVPPAIGPEFGLIAETDGRTTYVNLSAVEVVLDPLVVVTTTSTAPVLPAGDWHVRVVAFVTVTFVADTPPNVTLAPAMKLVPVTVTVVPPAVGPAVGVIDETVGNG
jgi:hypothetical protein